MDDREQKFIYIHKFGSFYRVSIQSTLGLRNPLLAWRDDQEIADRLAMMDLHAAAPDTITDKGVLRAQLTTIRAQGFAEEIEESKAGVRCIATPILDHLGKSVAAIRISVPLFRFDEAR